MINKFEINKVIAEFIYFANSRDLFYLTGDTNFLTDKNYNDGVIYKVGDNICQKYYYDDSMEYKLNKENLINNGKIIYKNNTEWLDLLDKKCEDNFHEKFIPYVLKKTRIINESIKRPCNYYEINLKELINILYGRDLRKEKIHLEALNELMLNDNNNIIYLLHKEIRKIIKFIDLKQNDPLVYAAILGLIIASDTTTSFPLTIKDAYNIFYKEVFRIFSEYSGYIVLNTPALYPIIYFSKMPNSFFKALPINFTGSNYDLRVEIQNIILNNITNDEWILNCNFDIYTLQLLCLFVLTDSFSIIKMKISGQEKFDFAYALFLLIIKVTHGKTLKSSELFWNDDIISLFMICCLSNYENHESSNYNKIYNIMKNPDGTFNPYKDNPFNLDKKIVKKEVLDNLKLEKNLDFIIFMFIISTQIEDNEILEIINNQDDIKVFAFEKNFKISKLIIKIKDKKTQEILQAIDDCFTLQTEKSADDLIFILRDTCNDFEISYNEQLTNSIHNMIISNIRYDDIYNKIKKDIVLKNINSSEKEKILELIATAEYYLKATDVKNYSPSVNQYCSALEKLLNEIIYVPYYFEVQSICYKTGKYNFKRDNYIKEKFFGNTPHAMWSKNNKLSIMGLGDLKILIENILNDTERYDVFSKFSGNMFKEINIKEFLNEICSALEIIKPDRDKASHGEILGLEIANTIRAKVYKNTNNIKTNPSDLIVKIDKNLKDKKY